MTFENSIWSAPPTLLELQPGEVHVWRLMLDQDPAQFRDLLHADELDRAGRFHFEKDRKHFLVARGFLRSLLGRYLSADPRLLEFSYGAYGKPRLDGPTPLRFNMSHSHGMALYAVNIEHNIGVDVEYMRADFTSDDIAARFFSPLEAESLSSFPAAERVAAFFRCWTRKEAFIKATGRGLSQPLDSFDVTLGPGNSAALLRTEDGPHEHWTLMDIAVGAGFAGALALDGSATSVCYWQGPDFKRGER